MPEKQNIHPVPHPSEDIIYTYLDGFLDESNRIIFESHLKNCMVCQSKVEELQSLFNTLDSFPEFSLQRDLSIEVLSTIQSKNSMNKSLKWGSIIQVFITLFVMTAVAPKLAAISWLTQIKLSVSQVKHLLIGQLTEWFFEIINQAISIQGFFLQSWSQMTETRSININSGLVIPLILSASLLWLLGNSLILRQITSHRLK
ncbi:MAG: hypothetical protein JEZ06_00100 [Anaerolineaceae bacterium]|nr:hypothetical protein [Anaerolineaceae bacterium]